MSEVWVGFTEYIVEQGYGHNTTSEPLIVFDNVKIANKWKKLESDRKIKRLEVQSKTECHICGSKL